MKFILALSLLTVLTSAASVDQAESLEIPVATPIPAAEVTVERLSSERVNDILNMIKKGVGKGFAGSDADSFASIFKQDFAKFFGNEELPSPEKIAQLKDMFGNDDSFKRILDSGIHEGLFPEKLVETFFGYDDKPELTDSDAAPVQAQIDETFANILDLDPELIKRNRVKAMKQLASLKNDPNFNWDKVFGGNSGNAENFNFGNYINTDL